jgi:hypothetical protein
MSSESSIGGEIDGKIFNEITYEMSKILFRNENKQVLLILQDILQGRRNIIEMIPLFPIIKDFDPKTVPVSIQATCGKIYMTNNWKTNPEDPNENPKSVIGKMMTSEPKPGYESECIEVGFLEENLTHLLLYLLYKRDKPYISNVFPQIYAICRTDSTNSPKSVIVIMEKVPSNFSNIFVYKSLIEQIDQLIVIASLLDELQLKYKFVHGDMHFGNIMLSKNMMQIKTDDISMDIKMDRSILLNAHLPYIIDLGRACIDLTFVSQKHVTYKTDTYHHCVNGAYDMRIFIASILHFMDDVLISFFIKRFRKYERYGINDYKNPNYFHNFYRNNKNDRYKFHPDIDNDESFRPFNLKCDLFELRKIHSETDVKIDPGVFGK